MLLYQKRVGLILRVFSPKPEFVAENVRQVLETLRLAVGLRLNTQRVFSQIDVLVSADVRYEDADCGLTRMAILSEIDREIREDIEERRRRDSGYAADDRIRISEVNRGDIFCGLLNYGVACQLRDRIDYSMILSIGAREYLTAENVEAMLRALEGGAKVTGLAITELEESILEGRIANTCAIWNNVALGVVGNFDLMARKVKNGEIRPNSGVEEIPPLLRMVELYGPCIAPILPNGGARWVTTGDPVREQKKLASKLERQQMHATALGYSNVVEALKAGVMRRYRS